MSWEAWTEKRGAARRAPVKAFEELSVHQKTILELAIQDGPVLLAGARMAPFLSAARVLVRKGLLKGQEDGKAFFSPTPEGLRLYAERNAKEGLEGGRKRVQV